MKNLNGLLERVLKYLDRTDAFLTNEVPEFCKQLMEYEKWGTQITYDICFWITFLFFFVTLITWICYIVREEEHYGVFSAITGFVFVLSIFFTVSSYKDLKMYEIAPKVYLVNTVKHLMSNPR